MEIKKKSRIGKIVKVGAVPTVATALLATGIIVPATVFSANLIGSDTAKSKIATRAMYKHIYGDGNWEAHISMKADPAYKGFKVNGQDSHVWKLTNPGDENKAVTKAVIFAHGLRNTHYNAITFARKFLDRGYTVFAYDQRESGENLKNGKISFGFHEADDLEDLYNRVTNKTINPLLSSVIVYGQSNGAGTTLSFGEQKQASVKAAKANGVETNFMIESGFVSWQTAIDGLVKGSTSASALSKFITPQMYNSMKALMNLPDADYDYAKNILNITQKLYIAHGAKDKVIPVDQGRSLAEARDEVKHTAYVDKTLYEEFPNLGHIGISLDKDSSKIMFDEAINWIEGTVNV